MTMLKEVLEDFGLETESSKEFWDCKVIFEDSWSSWEDAAFCIVFEYWEQLFEISHQYSSMACGEDIWEFDPKQISYSDLEELRKEWERLHQEE